MPDALFSHPLLARVYDAFDGNRDDLAAYLMIAGELGAGLVLDVGCGTGSLAVLLAGNGHRVVGIDPAAEPPTSLFAIPIDSWLTAPSSRRSRPFGDVRQAPDRPGREFVFLTERSS
ncbi:class I SAM-dependent methyltransferase [Frankia sp. AgPm24]|nr:methyltransferase domain-containing protein [Frankia sp. AgPm24]MCK9920704.1 class I SAM-dependent methyltransferase [Frankia sp. AgPm24]